MSSSMHPILATPPASSIILARPLSELRSCISNRNAISLELIIRTIKTLVLGIFRGHLYDRVALSTVDGILHSFSGKAESLLIEDMQKKYPHMLENAHVLIWKQQPMFYYKVSDFVDASSLGEAFLNNPQYTIGNFINSNYFYQETLRQPLERDIKRRFYYISKQGSPEDLLSFKTAYPDFPIKSFDVAVEFKNIPLVRHLIRAGDYPSSYDRTPLQKVLALGDLEAIDLMVSRGEAKNVLDTWGNNMMHYAALSGSLLFRAVKGAKSLELVRYLISQGASIACENCHKQTVLTLVNEPNYPNVEIKNYILGLQK